MINRIIICGYPKSGNTWLTRLTAELIGCPVAGFWGQPHNPEIAIEGGERVSNYECYKAHHSLSYLKSTLESSGNGTERIIYVVRDPRDVAVSASYYFLFPSLLHSGENRVKKKMRDWYIQLFGRKRDQSRIIQCMINGTDSFSWMNVPWDNHAKEFIKSDIHVIRYEDLLESTVDEADKLLAYMGLERSPAEIERAVRKQSFEFKKGQFLQQKKKRKAAFLRKGESGQWKTELTKKQIHKIEEAFRDIMVKLGYL